MAAVRTTLGDTRFEATRAESAGMSWTAALTEARRLLEEIAAEDPASVASSRSLQQESTPTRTSPCGRLPTDRVRRAAHEFVRPGAPGLSGHPGNQPILARGTAKRQRTHVARAGSAPTALPAFLQPRDAEQFTSARARSSFTSPTSSASWERPMAATRRCSGRPSRPRVTPL